MSETIRIIRSGFLVSAKTSQTGNRKYTKREIEQAHIDENGVERSRWDTTKVVFDPEEAKAASQIVNRARYIITRLCADTAHGPICPSDRLEDLKEAIKEAEEMVARFNRESVFTHIEVNVIIGEIRGDDEQAARALMSETEKLMTQMQEALEAADPKKIQALCTKALSVGQMLSPTANADIVAAVNIAREARKKLVKAGTQAAYQIDRNAIEAIGVARSSFLDFGMEEVGLDIEPGHATRALDFEPDEGSETDPSESESDSADAGDFVIIPDEDLPAEPAPRRGLDLDYIEMS